MVTGALNHYVRSKTIFSMIADIRLRFRLLLLAIFRSDTKAWQSSAIFFMTSSLQMISADDVDYLVRFLPERSNRLKIREIVDMRNTGC